MSGATRRGGLLAGAAAAPVLAWVAGTAVAGGAAFPGKPRALALSAALVVVGLALDPGLRPGSPPRLSLAVAWSAVLGLEAAALVALVPGAWPGPAGALGLGAGAGILALVLAVSARLLTGWLASAARARAILLLLLGVLGAAPLWLGPAAERLGSGSGPASLIVAASPLSYLARMGDYDYLRGQWFYAHTPIGSLRYGYPGKLAASAAYLGLALALMALEAGQARLRRGGR